LRRLCSLKPRISDMSMDATIAATMPVLSRGAASSPLSQLVGPAGWRRLELAHPGATPLLLAQAVQASSSSSAPAPLLLPPPPGSATTRASAATTTTAVAAVATAAAAAGAAAGALAGARRRRARWRVGAERHSRPVVTVSLRAAGPPTQRSGGKSSVVLTDRAGPEGGYSATEIQQNALQRPLALAGRVAQVAWGIGRFALAIRMDEWFDRIGPDVVKQRSKDLKDLLLALGPVYIKIGQALANRPDILRDDYMQELEALQDKVPPFPTSEAMNILREELGCDPMEVFAQLTPEPVAAASLGQVYRGRLRKRGAGGSTLQEVAVKVQRPGLRDVLTLDMYIFRQLAQLANEWSQQNLGCNITLIVDEFGAKLWEESNYEVEAMNISNFAQNFADDPTVKIPQVCFEHSSRRVITMEWISGVKSTDLAGMRRAGIDVDTFTRNGVQAALRQLLEFGLFHGDPHAGNVFAMADGRIAYVDFGNVATLSQRQRDVMVSAIAHVGNSEYEKLVEDFVRLGFLRPGVNPKAIAPAMADIWKDSLGTSIKDFNFRFITSRFSKLMYQFPFRVPERFSLVFRALLMQEGICLCLNPGFSIIEVALPYASKRLLSDPDPFMRRELMSIVFKEDDRGDSVLQLEKVKNLVEMARQDGTSFELGGVIVDFVRSLRRDLLASVRGAAAAANSLTGTSLPFPLLLPLLPLPPLPPLPAAAEPMLQRLRQLGESQRELARLSQRLLRGVTSSLTAGDGSLRLDEAQQVVKLLAPDLSPRLAREVAGALARDTLRDVLQELGVEATEELLDDPRRVGKALLGRRLKLSKFLALPAPA